MPPALKDTFFVLLLRIWLFSSPLIQFSARTLPAAAFSVATVSTSISAFLLLPLLARSSMFVLALKSVASTQIRFFQLQITSVLAVDAPPAALPVEPGSE